MANSWGGGSTTWGVGDWGDQDTTTVVLSGFSITGSLGTADAYHAAGWGRNTYGYGSWGVQGIHETVYPSSLTITGALGTADAFPNTGWGRDYWGEEPWGDSYDPVVTLDGLEITGALGTLPYAQSEEGWGRDEWGYGNWGENTTTVVLTDSFAMTAGFGPDGWGIAPWDEQVSWGGDPTLTTTQLSIAALTGLEMTGSLGTPTLAFDMINFAFTGPAAMGAGLGVPNINDGADHSQGTPSFLTTGSLGTVSHEMAYDLTGLSSTMSLGSVTITETQIVDLTGIQANFYALNVPSVDDMSVGLSGFSSTMSLGTPVVTDMQVGISGLQMSGELGSGGIAPLHYKDVDITGNTAYTYVKHAGEL